MSNFLNGLQSAVFTRLVSALSPVAVYDAAPDQLDGQPWADFPYVMVGDDTVSPFDTDDTLGFSATITIHVWSRYNGKREAKELMGKVYEALHRKADLLFTQNYRFVDCLYEFGEIYDEVDGKTRHGVCRFRIIMEKL